MTAANLTLSLVVGVLFAGGVHLVLDRSLFRIVLGFALLGHGANLVLLVAGGPAGSAPKTGKLSAVSDPLPQAMALTAVVITFAVTALLLALCDRAAVVYGDDGVRDDVQDRLLARDARAGEEP